MKRISLIYRLMIVAIFSVAACLCITPRSYAQVPAGKAVNGGKPAARLELPSGPLLRSAPDYSQWTISYFYAEERGNPAKPNLHVSLHPRPAHSRTIKTREVMHETVTDSTGKQTETWFSGQMQYIKPPGEALWRGSPNSDKDSIHDLYHTEELPPSGFRRLEWITPQNYIGKMRYHGDRDALIFVLGGTDKAVIGADTDMKVFSESQSILAYIDADTRMPIMVKNNDETRVFEFGTPPGEMQAVPSDLTRQLKKAEDDRTRLGTSALRPY